MLPLKTHDKPIQKLCSLLMWFRISVLSPIGHKSSSHKMYQESLSQILSNVTMLNESTKCVLNGCTN